ncbi:MAG: hypothetical protein ACLQT7_01480 [Candidatus Dormibacteria bacterium]
MTAVITAVLAVVIVATVALLAVGPLRAVREDRRYAAEERRWQADGTPPDRVERQYRNPRLILTDGARMRSLGYQLEERRMARGDWGRVLVAVWRATSPPQDLP